jgi:hypothetical protein
MFQKLDLFLSLGGGSRNPRVLLGPCNELTSITGHLYQYNYSYINTWDQALLMGDNRKNLQ